MDSADPGATVCPVFPIAGRRLPGVERVRLVPDAESHREFSDSLAQAAPEGPAIVTTVSIVT